MFSQMKKGNYVILSEQKMIHTLIPKEINNSIKREWYMIMSKKDSK